MSASKFTPEIRDGLIERTAAGISLPDACRALELRHNTVKGWLSRGRREDDSPHADFADAMEKARADAKARPGPMDEAELLVVVSELARKGSVQAARLRWEMICAQRAAEERPDEVATERSVIDELAARRAPEAAARS